MVPTAKIIGARYESALPSLRGKCLSDCIQVIAAERQFGRAQRFGVPRGKLPHVSMREPAQAGQEMMFDGYINNPLLPHDPSHFHQSRFHLGQMMKHPNEQAHVKGTLHKGQAVQISANQEDATSLKFS